MTGPKSTRPDPPAAIATITAQAVAGRFGWTDVANALWEGHKRPRAQISDQLLRRAQDTLLSRCAWIDGLGIGIKSMSIMPANTARHMPSVQGAMLFMDDETGTPRALIDGPLITYWKTAADSVLGARLLARPDARKLLILGAGAVAESLVHAYQEMFPDLDDIAIWNRTEARAAALVARCAARGAPARLVADLPAAAGAADIICTATMASGPVLQGDWVSPGTHIDMIGAYRPDMREGDDALLARARIFVDSRDTTVEHIGELMIPIAQGVIGQDDVLADLYDLAAGHPGRQSESDITLFKNGGGAHLDLMTAALMLEKAGDHPA